MHAKIFAIAIALGLFAGGAVLAQPAPGHDPVGDALFPPELVMSHQQVVGLSDSQKTAIQTAIEDAQKRFPQAQWQLAEAVEGLGTMLKQPRVDQSQVMTQLDKILGLEREIKRTQLTLMIRIKNTLSPEQQTRLRALKEAGAKP